MWNECSVKVASSSLTCAAASQSNQRVHSYALENGVRLILLRTAMWGHVSQLMRPARARRCLSRIGMPLLYEFSCWITNIWLYFFYPTYHLNISAYHIVRTNVNVDSFCHIPAYLHASGVPSHHTIPTLTHQTRTPRATRVWPTWPLPTCTRTRTNPYPCLRVQVLTGMGTGWPSVTWGLPTVITRLAPTRGTCDTIGSLPTRI